MKKTTGLVDLLLQSDIMKKTYTLENKRLDTNNSLIVESNFLFQTMIFKGPQALSFQECRLSRFFYEKKSSQKVLVFPIEFSPPQSERDHIQWNTFSAGKCSWDEIQGGNGKNRCKMVKMNGFVDIMIRYIR